MLVHWTRLYGVSVHFAVDLRSSKVEVNFLLFITQNKGLTCSCAGRVAKRSPVFVIMLIVFIAGQLKSENILLHIVHVIVKVDCNEKNFN